MSFPKVSTAKKVMPTSRGIVECCSEVILM
jgi:hypothetical protein